MGRRKAIEKHKEHGQEERDRKAQRAWAGGKTDEGMKRNEIKM